ncbi:MAG: 4-(cytidine 5'-diphospho)-2-C-methyl-D-erythritol kinase [Clostridium sp.]
MKCKAYAKINIALDIVGKREDGYHLLRMIMQAIDIYDEVEVLKSKSGIELSCNKPYLPTDSRNLAYRAAEKFMDKYNIKDGIKIHIKKNIPVAAGMAGGSADCAAVLRLMNKVFEVGASDEELMDLGLSLGADVPYCIKGGTALCEGIGEQVTMLKPFKDKILVVVKPNFGVSTRDVYGGFDLSKVIKHPKVEQLISAMERDDLYYVCDNMRNLLENVTLRKHNKIIKIKNDMNRLGAVNSMMSGSGPTVFAFFEDMMKAQNCFEEMKKEFKEVFITRTI